MGGRPASHIFAGLYFFTLAAGFVFTGYTMLQGSQSGYVSQFLFSAPYVVALVALFSTRARWSYFLGAFLIFAFPVFLIGSMLLILFKAEGATLGSISPSFIGSALLLWLFYAFTFGSSSKNFYGIGVAHESKQA